MFGTSKMDLMSSREVKVPPPVGQKYELSEEAAMINGVLHHRIRAVRAFSLPNGMSVASGQLGGWVENENNLAQEGKCWVTENAILSGNCRVEDDVLVRDNGYVCGDALLKDRVIVKDKGVVGHYAKLRGNIIVKETSQVLGYATLNGDFTIGGAAVITK